MDLAKQIEDLLTPSFENAGINIVCTYIFRLNTGMNVQVLIEKSNGDPVTIEDCIFCNRTASALLDVENLIKTEYNLEISSPGEYRPLTKIRDFDRFVGSFIKVELVDPVDDRKRFKGVIDKVEHIDENDALIYFKDIENADESITMAVRFSNIRKATLKVEFKI